MGVVVSPSGTGCEHVDIIDDTTGDKLGTITRREYGEIVGLPTDSWTAEHATNRQTIEDQAEAALDTNATFLDLTSPTNAQILAQVKALTRQNQGIIRLVLGRLETTE